MKDKSDEKNTAAVRQKKHDSGFSAYIGPNLPGVIQTMTIYPVGRDEALKRPELELAMQKHPDIADLVVDGSTLAEDRIKIKKHGETLYQKYCALRNR